MLDYAAVFLVIALVAAYSVSAALPPGLPVSPKSCSWSFWWAPW